MAKWPVFCLKSERLKTWEIIARLWPNKYRSTPKRSKSKKKPHETGLNSMKKYTRFRKVVKMAKNCLFSPIQAAENIYHIQIVAVLV